MNSRIRSSIVVAGATSTASQIILMREFFEVFYGNELSLALVLAIWLVFGAVGSMVAEKSLFKRSPGSSHNTEGPFRFGLLQLILSIGAPASILATRAIKPLFGVLPGQLISIWALLLSAVVILSPICIICGYLFTLGCKTYKSQKPYGSCGNVFFLESIGSALGGLAVSIVLLRFLKTIEIAAIISSINAASAYSISNEIEHSKKRRYLLSFASLLFALSLIFFHTTGLFKKLDRASLAKEFASFEVIKDRISIYGKIVIVKREGQISLFNNGLHTYSYPDKYTQEETVHFSMLLAETPRNVLLIGGGAGGSLEEVLKYPVERIDYVELDPAIVSLSREVLKEYGAKFLDNVKVHIANVDGRLFIRNPPVKYDVVIIDLPNPYTAQINRFYTKEFYTELAGILNEGGIVSFASASSESYIGQDLARFLSSLYKTVKRAFSDVSAVPGNRAIFLLSNKSGATAFDYQRYIDRLKERNIKTEHIRDYYLASRLSQANIYYLRSRLDEGEDVRMNLDFMPISYYYDLILWSSYFKDIFFSLLRNMQKEWIWVAFAASMWLIIAIGTNVGLRPRIALAVGINGFTLILFEIIIILTFQILYGYVFYKIGLIVTLFMAGLALGSFVMNKTLELVRAPLRIFRMLVTLTVGALALTTLVVFWLNQSRSNFMVAAGETIVSIVLPMVSGFIGGLIFPLAAKIYLNGLPDKLSSAYAGRLYGIDLLGAAVGAGLASSILIPIIGIYETLLILFILNLSALIFLKSDKGKRTKVNCESEPLDA